MKAHLYDSKGNKKGEMEMPSVFSTHIREDIIAKCIEATRYWHPHSTYKEAGKRHVASGIISHKRHDWKGQYGKGISRVPRKILWRRGIQFNWVGAEVSGTRGGRRSHPPKGLWQMGKINKKEMKMALSGAIAATAKKDYIVSRYGRIDSVAHELPFVIESKIDKMKSKELVAVLRKILGEMFDVALSKRVVRAGKGKLRGRKYKRSAGVLLVTGKDEKVKFSGVEVMAADKLDIRKLYPLGRLTVYTEKALEELK